MSTSMLVMLWGMKLVYERQDIQELVLADARSKGLVSGDSNSGWAIDWVRPDNSAFGPDHIELTIGEKRESSIRSFPAAS